MQLAHEFFRTARERYSIMLARTTSPHLPDLSRKYWTQDPIFQEWRFCNVHREHDKTTVWFKKNVRDYFVSGIQHNLHYGNVHTASWFVEGLLISTIAFRWFNLIDIGAVLHSELLSGWPEGASDRAYHLLKTRKTFTNAAYCIRSWDHTPKLPGILKCIDNAKAFLKMHVPDALALGKRWHLMTTRETQTLEGAFETLLQIRYFGGFMAYEIVSDLRWTPLLDHASDINTWANAGHGCARGISWVIDGQPGRFTMHAKRGQRQMLETMEQLLAMSRNDEYWPNEWQQWEMREVEHWACEFDKYMRAKNGERLKRRFA